MIARLLRLALPCFVLSCCSPLSLTAPEGVRALRLSKVEQRDCKAAHVTFPAGSYKPEVSSKHGTYYLAPAELRVSGVLIGTRYRGGVFVSKQGWQAAWFGDLRDDADGHDGTLFEAIGACTPRLYPLASPLPFSQPTLP